MRIAVVMLTLLILTLPSMAEDFVGDSLDLDLSDIGKAVRGIEAPVDFSPGFQVKARMEAGDWITEESMDPDLSIPAPDQPALMSITTPSLNTTGTPPRIRRSASNSSNTPIRIGDVHIVSLAEPSILPALATGATVLVLSQIRNRRPT